MSSLTSSVHPQHAYTEGTHTLAECLAQNNLCVWLRFPHPRQPTALHELPGRGCAIPQGAATNNSASYSEVYCANFFISGVVLETSRAIELIKRSSDW